MQTPIEFAKNFLIQLYTKQDVTAAMACLSQEMIWVAPAKSYHLKDQKEIYDFLKEEIRRSGQKYYVDVSDMMSDPCADTIRIVSFDVSLVPVDPKMTQYVRTSFVIRTAKDGFEIPFFHMSHRFSLSDPVPFRTFIEFLPGPIMVVRGLGSLDLRLAFQNGWFRGRLGYTEKEFDNLSKKDSFFMFLPADRDALKKAFSEPSPGAVTLRVTAKQKNGKNLNFEVTGQYAFEEEGAKVSYLEFHFLNDLLEEEKEARKREAEPLQKEIAALTAKREQAEKKLSEFRRESAARIAMERTKADKISAAASKEQARKLAQQAADFETERKESEERLKRERDDTVNRLNAEKSTLEQRLGDDDARIASLEDQLEASQKAAKEAELGRKEFLVRMQSDLRKPSEAALALLPRIEAGGLDDMQQDAVEKIREAAGIMLNMVDSLLNAAKLDNHERTYHESQFILHDLLREIRRDVSGWCREAELELAFDIGEKLPEVVIGDRDALKRVLLNILDNAVRYTNRGGKVSFSVTCGRLDGDVFPLHFSIIDTGIGIEESLMPVLFEPFSRGHENAVDPRMHPGFGLGLATANSLVRLMGGRIGVTSTPGVGSYFTVDVGVKAAIDRNGRLVEAREVTGPAASGDMDSGENSSMGESGSMDLGQMEMPMAGTVCMTDSVGGRENGSESGAVREKEKSAQKGVFHGRRILLAEDDPLNIEIVSGLLTRKGMVVVKSSSGAETVHAFRNHRAGYYSAILVDYHMPGMDGLETARQIRAVEAERSKAAAERGHEACRPVPIVALTQNSFEEDMSSSFGNTIDAGISKPIDPKRLYSLLGRILSPA